MLAARFRARLPADIWVATVSEAAPAATFRLLSGVRTDTTAIELGEVVADDPATISREIADQPAITGYEELEATDRRVLAKYETTDTVLYELVAESSLPVEYPVVVRNGWYELDLTATREEFDRFQATLETSGQPYELLSLVRTEDATGILTDRQREVLNAALRAGYFEVPRSCTLAELADELDIDKSTTSRILRRGATRVLQWYLTSPQEATTHPRK